MRPDPRRALRLEPPPADEDQTGWLVTFSDLVLQLFAFVLVSVVLTGAAKVPEATPPPAPPVAVAPVVTCPPAGAPPEEARTDAVAPRVVSLPERAAEPSAPPAEAIEDHGLDAAPSADPAPSPAGARLAAVGQSLRELVVAEGRADAVQVIVRDSDLIVTLSDTITFPSGNADLLAAAAPILHHIGSLARAVPDFDLEVGGHTDDVPIHTGSFPSNLELSLARAARVVHELATAAPELAGRAIAAGYGEHRPVASNADAEGRALNRRVEIRLVPREAKRFAAAP